MMLLHGIMVTGCPNEPEYNYVKEVDYISGASIMISKQLWNEIGGFDEHLLHTMKIVIGIRSAQAWIQSFTSLSLWLFI